MKLLLVLLAVGLAAGIDVTYDSKKGFTLYDLIDWVEALEGDFYTLVGDVSDVNTLIQVGIERLDYIYDHFLPQIRLANRQQDELAESIRKQLKQTQHVVDELRAAYSRVFFLAEHTRDTIATQLGEMVDISNRNDAQDNEIDDLEMDVADSKQAYLDNLAGNITSLTAEHSDLQTYVYEMRTFVNKRKCEYGHGIAYLDSKTNIKFKTKFEKVPSVAVVMNGFFAHLDGYGKKSAYHEYYIYKEVQYVNTDSFDLKVADVSDGKVIGKVMSCVWMACQYLDVDFEHNAI